MPCRDYHEDCEPSPNSKELSWLRNKIREDRRANVINSLHHMSGIVGEEYYVKDDISIDDATNLLCKLCTKAENLVYKNDTVETRKLAVWWDEHKRLDTLRLEEEEKANQLRIKNEKESLQRRIEAMEQKECVYCNKEHFKIEMWFSGQTEQWSCEECHTKYINKGEAK